MDVEEDKGDKDEEDDMDKEKDKDKEDKYEGDELQKEQEIEVIYTMGGEDEGSEPKAPPLSLRGRKRQASSLVASVEPLHQ
jgi:hypothetical protein